MLAFGSHLAGVLLEPLGRGVDRGGPVRAERLVVGVVQLERLDGFADRVVNQGDLARFPRFSPPPAFWLLLPGCWRPVGLVLVRVIPVAVVAGLVFVRARGLGASTRYRRGCARSWRTVRRPSRAGATRRCGRRRGRYRRWRSPAFAWFPSAFRTVLASRSNCWPPSNCRHACDPELVEGLLLVLGLVWSWFAVALIGFAFSLRRFSAFALLSRLVPFVVRGRCSHGFVVAVVRVLVPGLALWPWPCPGGPGRGLGGELEVAAVDDHVQAVCDQLLGVALVVGLLRPAFALTFAWRSRLLAPGSRLAPVAVGETWAKARAR